MTSESKNLVIITGAGSGVGRATALRFAGLGWRIALLGRRAGPLEETAGAAGPGASVWPCDLADAAAVADRARDITTALGAPAVVVHAAGTNTPRRSWVELSDADFEELMAANFRGAFHLTRALLPTMRARGEGTFVFVNSEAGLRANAKAGLAYVTSKFALAGLAQSLNAEERLGGVRACSIFPGDIDTPLLEKRPSAPPPEARARMLQADDVAACIVLAATLPGRALVEELVVRPTRAG